MGGRGASEAARSMVVAVVGVVVAAAAVLSPAAAGGLGKEAAALVAIKAALHDPGQVLRDWDPKSGDPCRWNMVTCHGGHVQELYALALLVVHGAANLSGTLSPAIGRLRSLRYLSLRQNAISGPIPKTIGRMKLLYVLDLSNNQFSGSIPSTRKLNNNSLSGPVPDSLTTARIHPVFIILLSSLHQYCSFIQLVAQWLPWLLELSSYFSNGVGVSEPLQLQKRSGGVVRGCMTMLRRSVVIWPIDNALADEYPLWISMEVRSMRVHIVKDTELPKDDGEELTPLRIVGVIEIKSDEGMCLDPRHLSMEHYKFKEIRKATNNFNQRNILGEGGYGIVYKGHLPNGTPIAVKRLKDHDSVIGDDQFHTEIEVISLAVHHNLLHLIGFCTANNERILVYPYMPNGTVASKLKECVNGEPVLDWPRRRIALGASRGLLYLHEQCDPKIIHRDIKGSNILLDESLEAIVADFGLAKLVDHGMSHVVTTVRGTVGRIPPEYFMSGHASEKTDVFCFGLLLIELVTGRETLELHHNEYQKGGILEWVSVFSCTFKIKFSLFTFFGEKRFG
ncbi:hypothetical protein C2845_PM05G25660 [Panicum miliaceum]|uniref:Protein kinase domain-containing protein n=1 Tax=Panicum miliaceum TaxID=4540 RepID=A0A3L6T1S8_PANMI|nr:hypothetical protein C2845_PM05G25660 [Panicum miliaceum]